MAYVTGSANTLADLLAAIQNACTANGWVLSAGGVLSKGACFTELKIASGVITIRGGTGVDGSGNLTGACDTPTGRLGQTWPGQVFTFPMTYFIHVNAAPDEVYVVCNFNVTYYQSVAFGTSATLGLVGSGGWYVGPFNDLPNNGWYRVAPVGTTGETGQGTVTSVFGKDGTTRFAGGVNHRMDSATWVVNGAYRDWASLFFRQPNQWNQESILMPIRVYANRSSGFISPVLECAHARFVSIANLDDKQIITLGSDRWKIYPYGLRGAAGSGNAGHAFRYDGP